ncbi:hypothetical protein GLA29479_3743 [Lysobacter antibioticus]|uniref:DUF3489 domain-containing protein n=1 Tax=Lysobacter antibioticus TaxID=84531 RepID=UPI000717197E|nr:DUF3489 domain-containing protein [Lysobacter antibioticus]ALN64594.1 hypothetical protein GLA29479_3743 [Lysobacter antibioticus]
MTKIELTPSQRAILELAVETDGRVESFPKNLGGGARSAVMRGLLLNGLIAAEGAGHALTDFGYEAVGKQPPAGAEADSDADDAETETEAETVAERVVADEPVGAPGDSLPETGDCTSDGDTSLAPAPSPVAAKAAKAAKAPKPPKEPKANRVEQVVAMLLRPEGATIPQVMEVTGWLPHSTRGFFAGALKKKGYTLVSDKSGKADRVYRIATEAGTEADDDRAGRSDEAK